MKKSYKKIEQHYKSCGSRGEKNIKWVESSFKGIMDNFLNLGKDTNIQTQKGQRSTVSIKSAKSTPIHIIINFQKLKTKSILSKHKRIHI
jgi:hypothetical protein